MNPDEPAFPTRFTSGMTIRAYLAGQAMAGLLARDLTPNFHGNSHIDHAHVRHRGPTTTATEAVEYADALIAKLSPKQEVFPSAPIRAEDVAGVAMSTKKQDFIVRFNK